MGESRYPLPTFYASFVLLQASPEIAGARAGVAYYAGGGGRGYFSLRTGQTQLALTSQKTLQVHLTIPCFTSKGEVPRCPNAFRGCMYVLTHMSIRPIHQWAQPTHQYDGHNNI